jgi:hypothetical protein
MKSFKALFVLFVAALLIAASFAPAFADPDPEEIAERGTIEIKRGLKSGEAELTFTLDVWTDTYGQYHTKTITVKDAGGETIQEIATADFNDGEDACTMNDDPNERLTFEDLNFDGWDDMRIVSGVPAGPFMPYIVWLWDADEKLFSHDEDLSGITDIEADAKTKTIKSNYRASAFEYGEEYYKYIDGKLTLVKSVETTFLDGDDEGMEEEVTSELKGGKMVETGRVKKKSEE